VGKTVKRGMLRGGFPWGSMFFIQNQLKKVTGRTKARKQEMWYISLGPYNRFFREGAQKNWFNKKHFYCFPKGGEKMENRAKGS